MEVILITIYNCENSSSIQNGRVSGFIFHVTINSIYE